MLFGRFSARNHSSGLAFGWGSLHRQRNGDQGGEFDHLYRNVQGRASSAWHQQGGASLYQTFGGNVIDRANCLWLCFVQEGNGFHTDGCADLHRHPAAPGLGVLAQALGKACCQGHWNKYIGASFAPAFLVASAPW